MAFLASLVECSDDAIFGLTLEGRISSWNKAAEEMYGYTAEEIVGQPVIRLSPEARIGEMEYNLERLRRGEKIPHFDTVRITKDRRLIDVSVRVSHVRDSFGAVTGAAVIARDITEQKRAREALASANRIKFQFLDNMSHEIRTPLNGVLGMTELVLDSELTADQRESLSLVKVSAESLLAAIDDMLDFSQIDAGKLKLEFIPFDLRESLGDTMKMLGFRAQKKGLELVYEVASEIPVELIGDPGRLRRILLNLVGNAIKFTERGDVVMTVRQESLTSEVSTLHFTVADTGIGIPAEQHGAIFDPFSQADGSSTRRFGGAGLGLAIASRLVALMQGKIWCESELGKGSTFHFVVPLQVQERSRSNPAPVNLDALRGLAVLIVDDNSVSRRVLRRMLSRWGMNAADVPNGAAALEAMRIAKDIGHPFPLVLLDGHMQEMDGFMIAGEIKKNHGMAGATIMMLTSVGHVGDAARCRDLGIAAYLVKPVRLSELVSAICLALEKTAGEAIPALVTRHILREVRSRLPDLK
ncbi:MAG: PAS domain S-box protein [Acidobacteriia bacterium]|nr:PAS domain S-box protein [Terriglobia bacterium]